jgi:hypothetical protein
VGDTTGFPATIAAGRSPFLSALTLFTGHLAGFVGR